MSKLYFTSDTHFGHANILKYCGRTLFMTKSDKEKYAYYLTQSEEEQRTFIVSKESLYRMNEGIIKRINERIKEEDKLFFLGDYCFKSDSSRGEGEPIKASYWQSRINCKNVIYIRGNHDKSSNSLKTCIERVVIGIDKKRINLVHKPEHADVNYSLNLTGHVHSDWLCKRIRKGNGITDCFNVGCDMHNFYPITWEEIKREYNKWLNQNF